MSSSLQSTPQLNHYNDKQKRYKTATTLTFTCIIAALSFSAVGCQTLQALEPTATLISNIKNSI